MNPGDGFVIETPGYGRGTLLAVRPQTNGVPGSTARFNTEVAEFSEDAEVAGKRATCVVAVLRVLGELRDLRVKAGCLRTHEPPRVRPWHQRQAPDPRDRHGELSGTGKTAVNPGGVFLIETPGSGGREVIASRVVANLGFSVVPWF